MFCNILAGKQKVRTFASLSRGKRTKEYDILKDIVKLNFSTAFKKNILKIFLKYLEVWKSRLNFANAFSKKKRAIQNEFFERF